MKYKKVYIEVIVHVMPDGNTKPLLMIWDDGKSRQKYEIDKVKEIRRGAAQKAGGMGMRYLVMMQGREKVLWYENPGWFVEVPENKYVERDEM